MSDRNWPGYGQVPWDSVGAPSSAAVLSRFFNTVYAWMACGLGVSALVAFYVSANPHVAQRMFTSGGIWAVIIGQFALVIAISYATQAISANVATALFLLYAALNGLLLAPILLVYTRTSVGAAFAATAGTFGAMSVYGFVTKRDLSALGSILIMALVGLILASIVNIFLASSALYWVVTYAGILIFVGLTAYDTQKLKQIAYGTQDDPTLAGRLAITGSLVLYLDFINLFLFLLRILGKRR